MHRAAPFILGAGRSGTTLLRLMVDAHPELAIPHETGVALAVGGLDDPTTVEDFVAAMTGMHTWADLATPRDALARAVARAADGDGTVRVAAAVRAFYAEYARARGKGRWGDKTPVHTHHIPALRALLPEARFVHVIRDGRAVAASIRHLWFRPSDTMAGIARGWVDAVETARAAGSGHPDYLEVRYEHLVRDPEAVLRQVCDHVDLAFDPAMLAYPEGAAARLGEVVDGYDADGRLLISRADRLRNHRWTSAPPEPARIDRWQQVLSRREVADVERVAGPLLETLGYPLTRRRTRLARRAARGGRSR